MQHVLLAVLTVIAVFGWTSAAEAVDPECGQDVMTLALKKCGTDIACMNAFVAGHKAKCAKQPAQSKKQSTSGQPLQDRLDACGMDIACMNKVMQDASGGGGQPPKPQPPKSQPTPGAVQTTPPPGGSPPKTNPRPTDNDIQKRIQACGADSACTNKVMNDVMNQFSGGGAPAINTSVEGDATGRVGEGATYMPRSWLQMLQNRFVACGDDQGCWQREMKAGQDKVGSVCGPVFGAGNGVICRLGGSAEVAIEYALAQQRINRKKVAARAPKPTAGKSASGATPGQTPNAATGKVSEGGGSYQVPLAEAERSEILALIAKWKSQMDLQVPKIGRDKVTDAVAKYPVSGPAKPAPLVYEEKQVGGDTQITIRPTRRDWAYAFNGTIFTMVGLIARGDESKKLLDLAFWCFLRAAELDMETEHLSNIGFHLNLRARLAESRKVLSYVSAQSPNDADAHNNLAFALAASGDQEQAEAEQAKAYDSDPANPHIQNAMSRFSHGPKPGKDGKTANSQRPPDDKSAKGGKAVRPTHPPGYDFGEAYFRLTKRQSIREWKLGRAWFQASKAAWGSITGGIPPVVGPYEEYQQRLSNIAADYENCTNSAPKILSGCPFGSYIVHPSCKNSPSPAQVAHSRRANEAAYCRCDAVKAGHTAQALNAYIEGSLDVWKDHERKWRYKLHDYATEWSADINAVNARYGAGEFQFPIEGNYTNFLLQQGEESQKFWTETYPDMLERWNNLRLKANSRVACIIPGPPPKAPQKRPDYPDKSKTQKTFVINLIVSSIEMRADGTAKFGVDVGFIKGSYEEMPGGKGWKAEVGSGPVDLSYEEYNKGPQKQRHPRDGLGPPGSGGSGGDDYRIGITVGVNASKFVPSVVKPIAGVLDEVLSVGAKFNASWGNGTGFKAGATTEAKSKVQITTTDTPIPGYTRLQN